MNRRAFFAALAAPFVAPLLPKPEPSIVAMIEARIATAQSQMVAMLDMEMYGPAYRSPYWHGEPPFVMFNCSRPPWGKP